MFEMIEKQSSLHVQLSLRFVAKIILKSCQLFANFFDKVAKKLPIFFKKLPIGNFLKQPFIVLFYHIY